MKKLLTILSVKKDLRETKIRGVIEATGGNVCKSVAGRGC